MNDFNPVQQLALVLGIPVAFTAVILAVVAFWTIIWKGLALWRSARNEQKWWFIAMLVINTVGMLEIIYLLWFRKDKDAMVTRVATGSAVVPEVQ